MTDPQTASNSASVEALQDVLDPVVDGINQLFFHSRALRAWGITEIGRAEHREWIVKMQLAEVLVVRLSALDGTPRSRDAIDLDLAGDVVGALTSNRALTERLIAVLDKAIAACAGDKATTDVLNDCRMVEIAYLDRLNGWLEAPDALPQPSQAKHLMPKDGGTSAIEAINRLMVPLTDCVSQFFYHSLIFTGWGEKDLAERELNAALDKMYRSEALLERLLDLGGAPDGHGFGRFDIGVSEAEIDRVSLERQKTIPPLVASARDLVDPSDDPTTYVMIDGVLRAEHADLAARKAAVS